MADKKISDLTATTTLSNTDVFPLVQGGTTKKITFSSLKIQTANYITPTSITAQAGANVDLGNTTYDNAELIKLSWTGGNGTAVYTLPDATSTNNTNRIIKFISNTTFTTNTHVEITPKSGQTLDGSSNDYDINKEYEGIQVWSDGSEWFIIQKKA